MVSNIWHALTTWLARVTIATIGWYTDMSRISSGTTLCEPTELYNIITQSARTPAVLNETYLVLFDARGSVDFNEAHITLAKNIHVDDKGGGYVIPFGVHLPSCQHCVVYDGNTVSTIEDTTAVKLANHLALNGSQNPVKILKGGYERFSAEYPFLRTPKILYTPMELQCLPRYPSEILPLFLYLGDCQHAYNASVNYDLKIHAHMSFGVELQSAYPGKIAELRFDIEDTPDEDLLSRFEEICQFLEGHRKKSERVLVYSERGISRPATGVIAYLMKRNKWTLQVALKYVQRCRHHVQPLMGFLEQLVKWEDQVLCETFTDIANL